MSALNTGSAKTQSTRCRHSLITSIADLRERCDVDPVTRCWNWLGGYNGYNNRSLIPRLWVYDYDRHDKVSVSGPRAAWMLAHEAAPLPGYVVYRACGNRRCLNPVHLRDGRKSDVGANARLSGRLKGTALESRRANLHLAYAAAGITPTSPDVVRAIRAAPSDVMLSSLAKLHGISPQTVSRIRRGESHREVV